MSEIIIRKPNEVSTQLGYSLIDRQYKQDTVIERSRIIEYFKKLLIDSFDPNVTIESNSEYRLKFPKWVIDGINSGQFEIRKDKHGERLAQIIDITKPKKPLVYNLRMDEFITNNPDRTRNFNNDLSNMLLRQQLIDISQTLLSIQTSVNSVQRGLFTDRIAQVVSGRERLEVAFQLDDQNPRKFDLINDAITSLSEGRSKLEYSIKDELKCVSNTPKSQFRIYINHLFNPKLYDNMNNQYSSLQDGIYAYFEATRLLVISYSLIDKNINTDRIIEPTINLILSSSKIMNNLSKVGEPDKSRNYWYNDPQTIVNELQQSSQLALPEDAEYITMDFSGKELLGSENHE